MNLQEEIKECARQLRLRGEENAKRYGGDPKTWILYEVQAEEFLRAKRTQTRRFLNGRLTQ